MPTLTHSWSFLADASDGSGNVLVDTGNSSAITFDWFASDGSPASGCVRFRVVGDAVGAIEIARASGTSETWETWGVPAGSTVTSVQCTSRRRKLITSLPASPPIDDTIEIKGRIVNSSASVIHSAGPLWDETFAANTSTGWVTVTSDPSRNIDASYQASTTSVRLELEYDATAGVGDNLDTRQDEIVLTITYTASSVISAPYASPLPFQSFSLSLRAQNAGSFCIGLPPSISGIPYAKTAELIHGRIDKRLELQRANVGPAYVTGFPAGPLGTVIPPSSIEKRPLLPMPNVGPSFCTGTPPEPIGQFPPFTGAYPQGNPMRLPPPLPQNVGPSFTTGFVPSVIGMSVPITAVLPTGAPPFRTALQPQNLGQYFSIGVLPNVIGVPLASVMPQGNTDRRFELPPLNRGPSYSSGFPTSLVGISVPFTASLTAMGGNNGRISLRANNGPATSFGQVPSIIGLSTPIAAILPRDGQTGRPSRAPINAGPSFTRGYTAAEIAPPGGATVPQILSAVQPIFQTRPSVRQSTNAVISWYAALNAVTPNPTTSGTTTEAPTYPEMAGYPLVDSFNDTIAMATLTRNASPGKVDLWIYILPNVIANMGNGSGATTGWISYKLVSDLTASHLGIGFLRDGNLLVSYNDNAGASKFVTSRTYRSAGEWTAAATFPHNAGFLKLIHANNTVWKFRSNYLLNGGLTIAPHTSISRIKSPLDGSAWTAEEECFALDFANKRWGLDLDSRIAPVYNFWDASLLGWTTEGISGGAVTIARQLKTNPDPSFNPLKTQYVMRITVVGTDLNTTENIRSPLLTWEQLGMTAGKNVKGIYALSAPGDFGWTPLETLDTLTYVKYQIQVIDSTGALVHTPIAITDKRNDVVASAITATSSGGYYPSVISAKRASATQIRLQLKITIRSTGATNATIDFGGFMLQMNPHEADRPPTPYAIPSYFGNRFALVLEESSNPSYGVGFVKTDNPHDWYQAHQSGLAINPTISGGSKSGDINENGDFLFYSDYYGTAANYKSLRTEVPATGGMSDPITDSDDTATLCQTAVPFMGQYRAITRVRNIWVMCVGYGDTALNGPPIHYISTDGGATWL